MFEPPRRLFADALAGPYEVRYGFTPVVVIGAPVLLLFAAWGVWSTVAVFQAESTAPSDSGGRWYVIGYLALVGAVVAFCGLLGGSWLVAGITRRLALRVDAHGVTLGRAFPPSRRVRVPWRDIQAIVIFTRAVSSEGFRMNVRHVGVRFRRNAVRPRGVARAGTFRGLLYRLNAGLTPWPADVFVAERGWRLDDSRLEGAMKRFGGHIPLVYAH